MEKLRVAWREGYGKVSTCSAPLPADLLAAIRAAAAPLQHAEKTPAEEQSAGGKPAEGRPVERRSDGDWLRFCTDGTDMGFSSDRTDVGFSTNGTRESEGGDVEASLGEPVRESGGGGVGHCGEDQRVACDNNNAAGTREGDSGKRGGASAESLIRQGRASGGLIGQGRANGGLVEEGLVNAALSLLQQKVKSVAGITRLALAVMYAPARGNGGRKLPSFFAPRSSTAPGPVGPARAGPPQPQGTVISTETSNDKPKVSPASVSAGGGLVGMGAVVTSELPPDRQRSPSDPPREGGLAVPQGLRAEPPECGYPSRSQGALQAENLARYRPRDGVAGEGNAPDLGAGAEAARGGKPAGTRRALLAQLEEADVAALEEGLSPAQVADLRLALHLQAHEVEQARAIWGAPVRREAANPRARPKKAVRGPMDAFIVDRRSV